MTDPELQGRFEVLKAQMDDFECMINEKKGDTLDIVRVLEEENTKLVNDNKRLHQYAGQLERKNRLLEEDVSEKD